MDRNDKRAVEGPTLHHPPPTKKIKNDSTTEVPTTRWWADSATISSSSSASIPSTSPLSPISNSTPSVDVIIPAHNAEVTIDDALSSAYFQSYVGLITLIVYDDNSSDDTVSKVQAFQERVGRGGSEAVGGNPPREVKLVRSGAEPAATGAGHARDMCVEAGSGSVLVLLDSDDVMMRERVEVQVATLLASVAPEKTIVGCRIYREPAGSTRHYTNWVNTLTEERLYLEQYRELTVLQPTWCLFRSRFDELDGYLRRVDFALEEETKEELRLAEDLRFWHKHMAKDGRLVLAPSDGPLLMYRHSEGLSQSSRTSLKLLMRLRLKAFEARVLGQEGWRDGFAVWGAGRDGKNFVKSIREELRDKIKVIVDVDEKKIASKFYFNRDLGNLKIPIVHFSELKEGGRFGSLPVVVCVAMYRTDGKLEENVASVGRVEGGNLWHFF